MKRETGQIIFRMTPLRGITVMKLEHKNSFKRAMPATIFCCLGVFVSVLLLSSSLVYAGEKCSSSRAANEILACEHCHEFKDILCTAALDKVDLKTYNLEHGILIQMDGSDKNSKKLVSRIMDEFWYLSVKNPQDETKNCTFCMERLKKVELLSKEKTETDSGAILILTSADPDLVTWLREDAEHKRKLLSQAK